MQIHSFDRKLSWLWTHWHYKMETPIHQKQQWLKHYHLVKELDFFENGAAVKGLKKELHLVNDEPKNIELVCINNDNIANNHDENENHSDGFDDEIHEKKQNDENIDVDDHEENYDEYNESLKIQTSKPIPKPRMILFPSEIDNYYKKKSLIQKYSWRW